MARFTLATNGQAIHLGVEGSIGGTSLALHLAGDSIKDGGRVIWACKEMPNASRFAQLFAHLSLTQSSRFHAMNLTVNLERDIDSILRAMKSLPSVSMIILDDWCDSSGRIGKDELAQMERLILAKKEDITLMLISKGSIDASGKSQGPIVVRSAKAMQQYGFTIATLSREKDGPFRTLIIGEQKNQLIIEDSGFLHR